MIKVFDTIQNLFCNPLRSLAARFGTERRRVFFSMMKPTFLDRKTFFFFVAFLVVPFSLSPLETKQHPDQKQEHKTTQQKRKSTFFNRASSFWTLPPVVLFNLSDAFAFVCLFASDSRRKKRALFFLSLSKAPERTRKERTRNAKKALLSFSFFDRKGKNLLLQESQKNKKKKKKKKDTKKERRINGDVEIHSGSNEEHAGSSSIHYEYIPRVVNSER